MKDLKKLANIDIHNAMIDALGRCVYYGTCRPPKHADIEYMTDVLKVFLHKKVEIKLAGYDRDGAGLWVELKKENGDEITVAIKGTTLTVGTKKIDADVYGLLQARNVLTEWLNETK